jgi:uncharacterized protein DUF4242
MGPMPRYLVERLFDDISDDDMLAAAVRSDEARNADFPDLTWEHTHVCVESDGSVTSFCVYAAPNEARIREHAEVFGAHVVGRVWEIVEDISPQSLHAKLAGIAPRAR